MCIDIGGRLALIAVALTQTAYGQVRIVLEPDHVMGTDTLWVDVRMASESDTLTQPVWAFQFRVQSDLGLRFMKASSSFALTETEGWQTDYNSFNGLVGGFSSRDQAIKRTGILIRLQFLVWGTDTTGNIQLQEFRLNSGNPGHVPAVPSLHLDYSVHLE
jgi:hypothetical protein